MALETMDKTYLLRLSEADYVRWRADAARRGLKFSEWIRQALNEGSGRAVKERKPASPPVREPEAASVGVGPIEQVAIPAGRAVPSPQGFTALRAQAQDLAARSGKCTADVARGTRCKLCGKIH